jgi:hypothetical protein
MNKPSNKLKIGRYQISCCMYLLARIDIIPSVNAEKVGRLNVLQFAWLFFSLELTLRNINED